MRLWLAAFMRRIADRLVDSHQRSQRRRCQQLQPHPDGLAAGLRAEIDAEHPEFRESLATRKVKRELAALESGKVAPINRKRELARAK